MATIKIDELTIGYREVVPSTKVEATPAHGAYSLRHDVRESSDHAETTLVFLHGVGSDKSAWDEQLTWFGKSCRAIAFDYPGYGESSVPARSLTREEMASYLLRALRSLGVKHACLVGLSLGGVLAFEMLRQDARLVTALVLADTFAAHPCGTEIVERTEDALAGMTMLEFAEKRVGVLVSPEASADLRHQIVESMARINPHAYRFATRAVWLADYTECVKQLEVPTLVLVGEHDGVTPLKLSSELQDSIPYAQLRIVSGAGHLSNLENPSEFNRYVAEFIERIGADALPDTRPAPVRRTTGGGASPGTEWTRGCALKLDAARREV